MQHWQSRMRYATAKRGDKAIGQGGQGEILIDEHAEKCRTMHSGRLAKMLGPTSIVER